MALSSGFAFTTQEYLDTLNREVKLRVFTPQSYGRINLANKEDREEVWRVGIDLDCTVHEDHVIVNLPQGYDLSRDLKVASGGFLISAHETITNIVNAWMAKTNRNTNVILVDWDELSHFKTNRIATGIAFIKELFIHKIAFIKELFIHKEKFTPEFQNNVYREASNNAIQVGEYVGSCLAALYKKSEVGPPNIHLVGHSLGAHVVGVVGRSFYKATGRKVDRVTGLDPAGPSFIDGPNVKAYPELFRNRLGKDAGQFVDIIHSQGSLRPQVLDIPGLDGKFGDLNPMGHADYYPDGGETQANCERLLPLARMGCSHARGFHYFINSIQEPELFPSFECSNLDECTQARTYFGDASSKDFDTPDAYMGEAAINFKTSRRKLYFLKLNKKEAWDYVSHGKYSNAFFERAKETLNLIKYALDGGGLFPKLGILPGLEKLPKKILSKVIGILDKLPWGWAGDAGPYLPGGPKYCKLFRFFPSCVFAKPPRPRCVICPVCSGCPLDPCKICRFFCPPHCW